MAEIQMDDIPDLVHSTLKDLGRPRFQQIAQNMRQYEAVQQWFRKDKVQFEEGIGVRRNLMTRLSRQGRHLGITTTVSADIPQLMDDIQVPWRHYYTPWEFTYDELLANKGKALIYKVIQPRRMDALIGMAEDLEAKAWQSPTLADTLSPYGLPYWIVYTASTTGAFVGTYPSGHTTIAGLSLTDSPNFKNYSHTYTSVTKADLIKKMRKGFRAIRWRSPTTNMDYSKSSYESLRLYTNETTVASLEDVGEAQNENLGRDLAPLAEQGSPGAAKGTDVERANGELLFRRVPVRHVPQMDDTAVFTAPTNPVYMIDNSTFYPVCMTGDFMREEKPKQLENQPRVFRVDIWLTYNYICHDRRRNAVFATA